MSIAKAVEVKMPLQRDMLPVAVSCAEQTAQAFGFGKEEQLCLSLAVEEVFAFLAAQGNGEEILRLTCRHGGYYMENACVFPPRSLPTKMFNMTARLTLEDENSLADMGLLLAARTVDHFKVVMEKDGGMGIYLTVEKRYPQVAPETATVLPETGFVLVQTGREEIKQFARQVTNFYNTAAPAFCHFPGKLLDMVSSGEYDLVLAMDDKGSVGGGLLWRYNGKMAEGYGPYIFSAQAGLAAVLVEGALEKLARSGVLCMIIRQPIGEIPVEYFETLGEYCSVAPDGTPQRHTALYRQIEEDNGMTVFVHPQLEPFIRERYNTLALPRQLRTTVYEGEGRLADSAISTQVDRLQKTAVLSILATGDDAQDNLTKHVAALRSEGIKNVFFELNLGKAEEVQLVPAILGAGFKPHLLLPWGGCGDLAVFSHLGEE